MPTRKIDYDKYAAGIFNRTERYANQVRRHFEAAVEQLLDISASMDLAEGDVFSFSANHRLSEEANNILRNLYANVYQDIRGGIASEWRFANLSADALVKSIFGKMAESDHFARYFMRNQDAMDAFFSRTSAYGGLNLSQRIWNYTGQFKDEMELALSVSMGRGESASTISRRVRGYLREPDRLFRRVRDEKDNLRLSKKAAAYHPGRGVYRSSYKNAMRLTRTETNMAYRTADHLRWQQMDFVIGIEIRISNHHPAPDICDDLKGRYPKDFKFVGWHPQCRCFAVPILSDLDDMLKWGRAVLDGTASIDDYSPEQITDMPKAFNNWVKDNAERITTAEYQPYFIRDNIDKVKSILNTSNQMTEKTWLLGRILDEAESKGLRWFGVDVREDTSSEAIIKAIGAQDKEGCCHSLALAYAGNRAGFEVYDFRGGTSREFFGSTINIAKMNSDLGGLSVFSAEGDMVSANLLLKEVEIGKEYMFSAGGHTAIVRRIVDDGVSRLQYLELQSAHNNGWKSITNEALRSRFNVQIRRSRRTFLLDIEKLKNDGYFEGMLGYINTPK